jgi:hypothetical protein
MRSRTFPSFMLGVLLLLGTACGGSAPALPQGTKPAVTTPQGAPTASSTRGALLPVPTTHPSQGAHFLQLQPDVPVPATCPEEVILKTAGVQKSSGLWIRPIPLRRRRSPESRCHPRMRLFKKRSPCSATPGANYPSIVNVPTPGCWQIQFNGAASMIVWVIGE